MRALANALNRIAIMSALLATFAYSFSYAWFFATAWAQVDPSLAPFRSVPNEMQAQYFFINVILAFIAAFATIEALGFMLIAALIDDEWLGDNAKKFRLQMTFGSLVAAGAAIYGSCGLIAALMRLRTIAL